VTHRGLHTSRAIRPRASRRSRSIHRPCPAERIHERCRPAFEPESVSQPAGKFHAATGTANAECWRPTSHRCSSSSVTQSIRHDTVGRQYADAFCADLHYALKQFAAKWYVPAALATAAVVWALTARSRAASRCSLFCPAHSQTTSVKPKPRAGARNEMQATCKTGSEGFLRTE